MEIIVPILILIFAVIGFINFIAQIVSAVKGQRASDLKKKYENRISLLDEELRNYKESNRQIKSRLLQLESVAAKVKALKKSTETVEKEKQQIIKECTLQKESIEIIGEKLIATNQKFLTKTLTPNNYAITKNKLVKLVEFCRKNAYDVKYAQEAAIYKELKRAFEEVVKKQEAKLEQARIKEQIRSEQRIEREIAGELKRIESEKKAIERALAQALKEANNEHDVEVQELQERLKEAEERNQRAISRAQLTKAGHVYVISNVGSFGEGVFKIGMTRRLLPMDRVKELGDASVPFPFDVHVMISCDDAPKLESELHRSFEMYRVNRVNMRKEFFRVDLETVIRTVEANFGQVDYIAEPEALEYYEGLAMQDAQQESFAKI